MSPIIVATGFNREAAIVAGPGIVTVAGGGNAAGLEQKLQAAVARGAAGIASFGLTGGLADGLAIGDWVVGDAIAGAIDLACDPHWRDALAARLPGARVGTFFADGRMIDTVAEKRALGRRHTALAVDMESHIAARVAQAHGLPFAIVRIISDEVDHLLPHAITVSMRPDGGIDAAAMAKSLAARPAQIADVVRTTRLFARGFRGLKQGAARIGPRMAFPG
ncbi:phosphorylase family protein [Sphingomonas nostoxanthinifaciens]|uniref:phosphorylase family protein n=1 Tax=Sphingomonas nostoxanthinifaciens TaxID=2872652 RepID=UPI001CC1CE8C|nr:phosphorylase [Sphingomonas nostoxanthinifaciens]UAK23496.1 phosphorylase [Sphingomonas nostoxanthinifaciens]